MTQQSGRFLIFLIDFIEFIIRLSKSSFAIVSLMVSLVMSFIFETTIVKFAYASKIPEKYVNREIYQGNVQETDQTG